MDIDTPLGQTYCPVVADAYYDATCSYYRIPHRRGASLQDWIREHGTEEFPDRDALARLRVCLRPFAGTHPGRYVVLPDAEEATWNALLEATNGADIVAVTGESVIGLPRTRIAALGPEFYVRGVERLPDLPEYHMHRERVLDVYAAQYFRRFNMLLALALRDLAGADESRLRAFYRALRRNVRALIKRALKEVEVPVDRAEPLRHRSLVRMLYGRHDVPRDYTAKVIGGLMDTHGAAAETWLRSAYPRLDAEAREKALDDDQHVGMLLRSLHAVGEALYEPSAGAFVRRLAGAGDLVCPVLRTNIGCDMGSKPEPEAEAIEACTHPRRKGKRWCRACRRKRRLRRRMAKAGAARPKTLCERVALERPCHLCGDYACQERKGGEALGVLLQHANTTDMACPQTLFQRAVGGDRNLRRYVEHLRKVSARTPSDAGVTTVVFVESPFRSKACTYSLRHMRVLPDGVRHMRSKDKSGEMRVIGSRLGEDGPFLVEHREEGIPSVLFLMRT